VNPAAGSRAEWNAHRETAFRAARRILGGDEDALDVAQEAIFELARRGGEVSAAGTRAWLVRVATNRAIDRLRRRDPLGGAERLDADSAPAPAARDAVEDAELRRRVRGALATLAPRQAEVIVLRIFEEMSFTDLAGTLGISEGAAKVHFRRALEHLRDRLGLLSPDDANHPTDSTRSPR